MEKRLLLGIDIGTSGCKLTVFDWDGQVIAGASGAYPTVYPAPGWVEQDAEQWWRVVCRQLRGLIANQPVDPKAIAAIGIDGTSWACLPVDGAGQPLRRALLWLDRRAEVQAGWLRERFGAAQLGGISGNPVDPAYITPKILWLKEREPEIYRQTHRFLQSNAYIGFKLTGAYAQDFSQGYGFHFFDIVHGCWNGDLAEKMGISLDLLAPLVHCHEVIGTVTRSAAEETGLNQGIPVVAGGLDAACCTLGAGVIRPGQTQEQGGQAGGMSIGLDRPLMHPRLILGYHVLPGQWLLQGGTVGGGGALRWFNEQLGGFEQELGRQLRRSPFELMSEAATEIAPGAGGLIFLPYMAGERSPLWNSKARGVFFGLSYEKTRAHLIRSVMEGVGYSLLHNLETAREVGAEVEQLVSVGGAANSAVWTQIKADITGKVIQVPFSDHATTLGAALLAGVGTGVYPDFETAVRRTVRVQRVHSPDPARHEVYRQFYQLYLELYQNLTGCYDRLDAIAGLTAGTH